MPRTGNVVVAQGGGPTPVINASLRGVVRQAAAELDGNCSIWGARNGITGVLQDRWIDLKTVSGSLWDTIAASPGSALGSCRKMLNTEEAARAISVLKAKDVRYFFYIGGNDSMDTAMKMNRAALDLRYEMQCCGIPKTIDNDLPHTDHCPGFGSAARFIAQSTIDLGMDIRSLPTPVSIIEVRNWAFAPAVTSRACWDGLLNCWSHPQTDARPKRLARLDSLVQGRATRALWFPSSASPAPHTMQAMVLSCWKRSRARPAVCRWITLPTTGMTSGTNIVPTPSR